MLQYFSTPAFAHGICGLAYSIRTKDEAVILRLPALTAQVQVTVRGSVCHECGLGSSDPSVALLGASNGAGNVTLAANTNVIGLGLLPTGWARTVRASAAEFSDAIVPGDAVWGRASTSMLLETMATAPDEASAVAHLFRFVALQQLGARDVVEQRIAVISEWLSKAGTAEIDVLAEKLDLSIRQTERLTATLFGAGPRILELKYRVLRLAAVSALTQTRIYDVGRADLIDSFYDQSHLIRTFQRFVGYTPQRFEQTADFSRTMLQGRWNGGARTPMTLWS